MNQDNDRQKASDIDSQVSDQYASSADEKTPVDLDQAVLREATRALRADNRKGSFGAWFRPVAFMAMVGLSLVIILDLSDTSIFDPPADMSLETAPSAPVEPPAKNAADAERYRGQQTISELKRQEKAAARNSSVDAPDGDSDDAVASAPQRRKLLRMQVDPEAADSRQQARPTEDYTEARDSLAAEAESTAQPATAVQSSIAKMSLVTPLLCSDEQKADAEAWWDCIESLRQSGQIEAAASELENLRKSFPDFALPE